MYDIATIKNKKDINEYHTQIIQFESIYTKTFPVDEQEPF